MFRLSNELAITPFLFSPPFLISATITKVSNRFCCSKRREFCLIEVDLVPKNRKALACLVDQVVIVVRTTCHRSFCFVLVVKYFSDKEKYATLGIVTTLTSVVTQEMN